MSTEALRQALSSSEGLGVAGTRAGPPRSSSPGRGRGGAPRAPFPPRVPALCLLPPSFLLPGGRLPRPAFCMLLWVVF